MIKEDYRILAINPGGRYVGLALFVDLELRDWQIKTLSYPTIDQKLQSLFRTIFDLRDKHKLNTIVIKKLHPSRTSKNLTILNQKIRDFASKHRFTTYEYSIDDVKRMLLSGKKGNKKLLMEEMSFHYPDLKLNLQKEKSNKNKYFERMFEAVALGYIVINKLT